MLMLSLLSWPKGSLIYPHSFTMADVEDRKKLLEDQALNISCAPNQASTLVKP
jgi:hypothetical protein